MEETLGKRIVFHRKRLGLTQDQMAEKLGVTPQAVSKWENDQSCPDITMLPRLAELFDISTDALLGREPVYEGTVVQEKEEEEEKGGRWTVSLDAGRRDGITTALFVLLVGGLTLASRLLDWDVSFWDILWPSALLLFGMKHFLERPRFTWLCCSLLGLWFLVDHLNVTSFHLDNSLIFPILVVLFGLSLLIDALRKPPKSRFRIHRKGKTGRKSFHQEGEHFDVSRTFGDSNNRIDLPRLSRGNIDLQFGDMIVDLTGCGEVAPDCTVHTSVQFGDLDLIIPRRYRVIVEAESSFGSINLSGHPDPDASPIRLSGSVKFGDLTIRYV